jgi:hypothetical protein
MLKNINKINNINNNINKINNRINNIRYSLLSTSVNDKYPVKVNQKPLKTKHNFYSFLSLKVVKINHLNNKK